MKKFYIDMEFLQGEGLDLLYNIATDIDVVENNNFYLNDATNGCRIVRKGDKISFSVTSEAELALKLKYNENMHVLS